MYKSMRQRKAFVFLFALVLGIGCQSVPPTQSSAPMPDGLPVGVDSTYFFANDLQVRVGRRGEIFEGVWDNTPVIFIAGLWVSAQQQGLFRGNITWAGSLPFSNYTTRWREGHAGVFHLGPEQVADPSFLWPTEFGAPTTLSGARMLYGDTMVWSAMQSDFSQFIPVLAQPIGNLRVTHAVFGYQRSDLRNVLFVRYDLRNYGPDPLTNVYLGYYSDTDLVDPNTNAVGYDPERGLTYTYTPSEINTSPVHYVAGYAFLDAPTPAVAHRPIWKMDVPIYDEPNFFSAQQIGFALQGLTNDGRSMVNPFTGEETRYGLAGDPVTQTGWIDDARDVRSLISSGPFQLGSNEEVSATVLWVVEKDDSLEGALNKVKAKIDQVRSESVLWSF